MLRPAIARHLSMKTRLHLTCWLALLLSCLALPSLRAAQFGPYTYTISGTGNTASIRIIEYVETLAGAGPAIVPASIEGVPVTAIGDYAFSRITNLTGLTLPDSITSVGIFSFGGCTGLTSLSLPASLIRIGGAAFSGCTGLISVSLAYGLISIGAYTFSGCVGLISLSLPASLTSIGSFTFENCTSLTSLTSLNLPEPA